MFSAPSYIMFAVAVLLYGTSSALFFLEIARRGATKGPSSALPTVLLGIAALAHFGFVVVASFIARVCPVHSVHFFLSMASLFATAAYLIARRRFRIHALGVVVAPTGLIVTLGTFFIGTPGPARRLSASFIGLHVVANLIGDALFLLACGAAIMYLVQEKRLKNKKTPLATRGKLPPLDSLDKAVHRFLLAGFPLLTLGVATGTVGAPKLEMGTADEVLRAVFGYATWLLIAAVLLLRVVAGWRGRRAAYGTVAGFACALVVLLVYLIRPVLRAAETAPGG